MKYIDEKKNNLIDIGEKVMEKKWSWIGHLVRPNDGRWANEIMHRRKARKVGQYSLNINYHMLFHFASLNSL